MVGSALTLLVLTAAWSAHWIPFDLEAQHLRAVFWGFLAAPLLLPRSILAWREPYL